MAACSRADGPGRDTAMHQPSEIPCYIIAGPLGVGKTSAVLHHLRTHASQQRVGVLVNDFGPVGLDGATLRSEAPETRVLNVSGGCICCTLLSELPKKIQQLLSEQALDRLIIEPSGMATPTQVIGLLRASQRELNIRLHPCLVMLSAVDFDEETFERMPYYRMFCEAADVLVFNRCDQASAAKVERARRWAERLDPPKLRVVTTSHGQLPEELFRLPEAGPEPTTSHPDPDHGHDPSMRPGGCVLDAGRTFDEQALRVNLMRICCQGVAGNEVLRFKGMFQTHAGWRAFEIANRAVSHRPSAHRGDSRMEWVTQPAAVDGAQMLAELNRPLDRSEVAEALQQD